MNHSIFPDAVAFERGHASEVALAALADGQNDLLGANLHQHVEACASCTARLGEAALLSAKVGDAIRARAAAGAPAAVRAATVLAPLAAPPAPRVGASVPPTRRPVPLLAIAAALALAVVCAGPSLTEIGATPPWVESVRLSLQVAGRLALMVARGAWQPSRGAVAAQWFVAGAFVLLGLLVAARVGRRPPVQGEV